MDKAELEKLASELESLALTPQVSTGYGPLELLSGLHKEAEEKIDHNYTTSMIHGILSSLENIK